MDPVSHAVFGQTLVTALGRQALPLRARVIAGVLGALAPDVDAVLMPVGWDCIFEPMKSARIHSPVGC